MLANISPATLTYDAAPASRILGQSLAGLNGSVSGFVAGESLSNDTAGALLWTTPVNAGSRPGQYAIDGSGLTAANYVFLQSSGNATALTLQPAAVPPPATLEPTLSRSAKSAIASSQAMMQNASAESPDALLCNVAAASGAQACNLISNSAALSARADNPVADTQRMIGTTGGSLRIVGGGVRLPQ